jgi:hypothetical protein
MTKAGLYAIGTSTPLESNKSLKGLSLLLRYCGSPDFHR